MLGSSAREPPWGAANKPHAPTASLCAPWKAGARDTTRVWLSVSDNVANEAYFYNNMALGIPRVGLAFSKADFQNWQFRTGAHLWENRRY